MGRETGRVGKKLVCFEWGSKAMSSKKKTKKAKLDGVIAASDGRHPAQVSGSFQNDPTFEAFRKILREQREEDYRRAEEEIEAAKKCSSSTPIRSRTTKTRTRSSSTG